jgi:hypothetical protein
LRVPVLGPSTLALIRLGIKVNGGSNTPVRFP